MRLKRKNSAEGMLDRLQGQNSGNNSASSQGQQRQISDNYLDASSTNVNVTISSDQDSESSSSLNEIQSQQKEEPLFVNVRDIATGEIITRKMQANQIWHLEKTKKVIVELNGNGQGNDNGANLLVRFLGKLAQNSTICPISVEKWNWMPEDNSRQQWNYIEENFEFDYAAGIKWTMSTLGERWKAYKYRLRCKHFYPNKSKEQILANPPSGVNFVDWTAFVHHYKDDKMKAQSLQNAQSRKKLKVSHAGGSKSNARKGHEMELQLGRPVCRSEVILSTLLKKDGNYINEEGKILVDKISEHLSQDQERAATLGVPSKVLAYPDDAIGKVYGAERSGRVRGLGVGVCPSIVFEKPGHSAGSVNFGGSSQQCVEDLKKHVKSLEVKLVGYEDMKVGYEETKEQLVETQKQLATVHKFLQDKFGMEASTLDG